MCSLPFIKSTAIPSLFSFAYCNDFDKHLNSLEKLAAPEEWNHRKNPSLKPRPILFNYIHHTFKRVKEECDNLPSCAKICVQERKCCFNTGLFTTNYEPIYGLFGENSIPGKQPWYLIGFFKESDYNLKDFPNLPDRASYFGDISDLVFDSRFTIRVNIDHILETPENFQRLPIELQQADKHYIRTLFEGAISTIRKKLATNYKVAIPQYYNGKVQLLIPLNLNPANRADLALAIYREGSYYAGRTCLTLDMAYNNARLIVKPESDWLEP